MRSGLNLWKKLSAWVLMAVSLPTFADLQMNMHKGVTPISQDIYDLHMIAMAVCVVIGIIVFGVMIYSLIYHRKSKGHEAASFHENFKLEILWAIIPFFILVGLAIPATRVLINMDNNEDSDITIKVVGHQWKWEYQYLDQGISFYSNLSTPSAQLENKEKKGKWYLLEVDKPLVLPIHRKVRFLVTSNDVIHAWWVPDLGVKRDAIPGFIHEAWAVIKKPGVYRGQCAELCGINHGFMPIVVNAVSSEDFDAWVAKQKKVEQHQRDVAADPSQQAADMSMKELMTLGKEKYALVCAACHKLDGKGMPPLFPALQGSSVAVGSPISRHIKLVLKGVAGSAMQAFDKQLNNRELAAVITYERNAWSNNTGDIVQPADIAAVKRGEEVKPKMKKKKLTAEAMAEDAKAAESAATKVQDETADAAKEETKAGEKQ